MAGKSKKAAKGKGEAGKKKQREKKVEFIFQAPEVTQVCLAGEFNNWDPQSLPMAPGAQGDWRLELRLLPGRYEYKVFVDRNWREETPCTVMMEGACIQEPSATELTVNPFGTRNFVLRVE